MERSSKKNNGWGISMKDAFGNEWEKLEGEWSGYRPKLPPYWIEKTIYKPIGFDKTFTIAEPEKDTRRIVIKENKEGKFFNIMYYPHRNHQIGIGKIRYEDRDSTKKNLEEDIESIIESGEDLYVALQELEGIELYGE